MKLVEREYGIEIELRENNIAVLVIENVCRRSLLINELYTQLLGNDGSWILADAGKSYDIKKKCDLILNPFSLELNNKKIVTKLYSEIKDIANEECYQDGLDLHSHFCSYMETILQKVSYPIKYDDSWDVNKVLKMYDVALDDESCDLFGKFLNYLKLMDQIAGIKIFVAVNIKQLFSEEQIMELYKLVCYSKIYLVLIEFSAGDTRFQEENIYILDKDDCIIVY
ncbi:MAG: type II-A CRISPR-associated protein Csn2 [Coprococcus sp.]